MGTVALTWTLCSRWHSLELFDAGHLPSLGIRLDGERIGWMRSVRDDQQTWSAQEVSENSIINKLTILPQSRQGKCMVPFLLVPAVPLPFSPSCGVDDRDLFPL